MTALVIPYVEIWAADPIRQIPGSPFEEERKGDERQATHIYVHRLTQRDDLLTYRVGIKLQNPEDAEQIPFRHFATFSADMKIQGGKLVLFGEGQTFFAHADLKGSNVFLVARDFQDGSISSETKLVLTDQAKGAAYSIVTIFQPIPRQMGRRSRSKSSCQIVGLENQTIITKLICG